MTRRISAVLAGLIAAGALSLSAMAQGSGPFGGFKHDREAPVEISADALEVRQADSIAIFSGQVVAGQGTLRLTAERVEVTFDPEAEGEGETGAIKTMKANGNVFLSNGAETAQGREAEYNLDTGMVRMRGDVILTQGDNVGKGETLVINLNTGEATMKGRVSLILKPTDPATSN